MLRLLICQLLICCTIALHSQNVGIGTTEPTAKLEIETNGSLTAPQLMLHEIGNDYARLKFKNSNGTNFWTIGGYIAGSPNNDIFLIRNESNGDLLSIKGNGKVGIDVGISPKTNLHIGEDNRVLFGKDTIGSGDKLMFLPDLHAFRVGSISSGASSSYWNRDSIGLYSFASGRDTRAQGFGATAMGRDTEASNSYAFASGYFSNADGNYSTAMGFNCDARSEASFAVGYTCDADERYSIAMGYFADAEAERSVALGSHVQAQAFSSISLGSYNVGGGDPLSWIESDPILEVGIGQSEANKKNALTILKDGKHGIMTNSPKANLHVKEDGIFGSGTIVAVIESDVSDRPILQFSETQLGDADSGMSIEYDGSGSGSSNKMYINKTGGIPMITFENSGQVGIGLINPTIALHLPDNVTTGKARAHSWTTYSDQRIKTNVQASPYGLQSILLLNPVSYKQHNSHFEEGNLIIDEKHTATIGLIAQETYDVIPEAVIKPLDENEQLWGMDYDKLIPVLIKGMQEQQTQIVALQKEVRILKSLQEASVQTTDF